MNHFTLAMKPSTMGKEAYALGLELKKVWKQHAFLKQQVVFSYTGCGTNVQWVFIVQADEDKGNFESVPSNFSAILNAVNLEMIERPQLLDPPVTADNWEKTIVCCRVQGADRKLVVMSFPAYAQHVLAVQHVPYQYWELVRGVIGAGLDGFVYHPPHVRTPARTKTMKHRGGKSPKRAVSLRQQMEGEGGRRRQRRWTNCNQNFHPAQKSRRRKRKITSEKRRGKSLHPSRF